MKKKYLSLFLLLVSFLNTYGEGESLSFDDLDEKEAAPAPLLEVRGIQFSLYADATLTGGAYEAVTAGKKSWEPYLEFGQNHFNVMGLVSREGFSASFDISTASQFLELSFQGERGALTAGRIFLPFGSAEYHHLYGGYADESGIFLPFFWTDYGIKGNLEMGDVFSVDLAVTNGAHLSGNVPVWSGAENNLMKAATLRLNIAPTLTTRGSFSFMFDSLSDDTSDLWETSFLMVGTDWSQRMGALTLKGGGAYMDMRIKDSSSYNRWAWYGEANYRFSRFSLRFRAGGRDPDSQILNQYDAVNMNAGLIVPFRNCEWQTTYLYNVPLGGTTGSKTEMSHQVMTKLLVRL